MQLTIDWPTETPAPGGELIERAAEFCSAPPHHRQPYARRDWGGPLHSLCSYQGKLKPAIAHFLIVWFTKPGDRVLDPMSGVGTVPLEARRQGRTGIAADLSRLAATVSKAKLEPCDEGAVWELVRHLTGAIDTGPPLEALTLATDVDFGLNGPVRDYFHPDTLREVLIAREFFRAHSAPAADHPARAIVMASVLHILHGNRPYCLSRRSHPVTPFAPTGPFEYRGLIARLHRRLRRVMPELAALNTTCPPGEAYESDFRALDIAPVDAVITSPPFARSLRFWSTNWMRLWFAGWDRDAFQSEPPRYLETQQRASYAPYADFATAMARLVKPGGLLIMHLGETTGHSMAEQVVPYLDGRFHVEYVGRESVEGGERHGLTDKGSTIAHEYVFARRIE